MSRAKKIEEKLNEQYKREGFLARRLEALNEEYDRVAKVVKGSEIVQGVAALGSVGAALLIASSDDFHTMVAKDGINFLSSPEAAPLWITFGVGMAVSFIAEGVKRHEAKKQNRIVDRIEEDQAEQETVQTTIDRFEAALPGAQAQDDAQAAAEHAAYKEKFFANMKEIDAALETAAKVKPDPKADEAIMDGNPFIGDLTK